MRNIYEDMPNKNFLEEYPLYRKFKTNISWYRDYKAGIKADELEKPAIKMYCSVCGSDQTFNMFNEYYDKHTNEIVNDRIRDLRYRCASCNKFQRIFLVAFHTKKGDKDSDFLVLEKVGQYPAWSIDMDKELEKMLGEHAEYYRRGLICESQSYGIGAYAYFRRITEDVIDELLESILDLVEEDEKELYKKKLEEVKKEKIVENKISLVKDLLPKSLQAEGMNPLKELYSVLSQGIHNETDEECIERAEAIRGILVFLVNQVMRTKKDKKSFTNGMKRILEKKKN